MKTLSKTWLAAVAAAILLSTPTMSAEAGDLKDATQIVNRTNNAQYYAANDGRALVRMKIVDSKGRSQRRQFAVGRIPLIANPVQCGPQIARNGFAIGAQPRIFLAQRRSTAPIGKPTQHRADHQRGNDDQTDNKRIHNNFL